jgi:large subunit ribosomal protein L17
MRHRKDGFKLGLAERMITLAKRDSLHARRQVLALVPDVQVVGRVFGTIAPRFGDRIGGYTRIIKAGRRPGDNAPLVLLELVDRVETAQEKERRAEKKEKAPKGEAGASGKRKKKQKAAAASA